MNITEIILLIILSVECTGYSFIHILGAASQGSDQTVWSCNVDTIYIPTTIATISCNWQSSG